MAAFLSVLRLYLTSQSITSCPLSFSVDVHRDGSKVKENEAVQREWGTLKVIVEGLWNMYSPSQMPNHGPESESAPAQIDGRIIQNENLKCQSETLNLSSVQRNVMTFII